jgi:predicted porin
MKNIKSLVALGMVALFATAQANATVCTDYVSGVAYDTNLDRFEVEHNSAKYSYFNIGSATSANLAVNKQLSNGMTLIL